jgi:hypothetical protein
MTEQLLKDGSPGINILNRRAIGSDGNGGHPLNLPVSTALVGQNAHSQAVNDPAKTGHKALRKAGADVNKERYRILKKSMADPIVKARSIILYGSFSRKGILNRPFHGGSSRKNGDLPRFHVPQGETVWLSQLVELPTEFILKKRGRISFSGFPTSTDAI